MNPLRMGMNQNQGMGNPNQIPQGGPGPINQAGRPMNFMERMIFNRLYNSNPKFRELADSMQGKTPEQAFQERGLDYSQFQNVDPSLIRRMLGF